MNYEDRVTKGYIEGALAEKCGVTVGSYVGTWNGNSSDMYIGQEIALGYRPKAVLVFAAAEVNAGVVTSQLATDGCSSVYVEITSTGFRVQGYLNLSARGPYRYIAFR